MAKKKVATNETNIDDLYTDIASETGGDVLENLETVDFFIDTGNLSVNYSCSGKFMNGGIPGGRITEAFGPEASGKSLFASNVLYGAQRMDAWCILLDCENASNGEFMERVSHLNLKRVLRYTPSSLERAFRQIHVVSNRIREKEKEMAKASGSKKVEHKPIVVIFDSLTVPPCERELRENQLPLDFSVAEWKKLVGAKEQPGERAKVISAAMRKLQAESVKLNITCYIINQTRDKIGVMYGNPETTPGGNAMKFYASLRFRTQSKKKIEHKDLGIFSGINLQVKNVKNRTFRPFVVADDVRLYFDEGIDPISGLLIPLLQEERIIQKTGGNYEVVADCLPDGQDAYKFKCRKADNRIPLKVLLDCPKLIDAVDAAQVQSYMDVWGGGLAATESGAYGEKTLQIDAEGNPFESDIFDDEGDED